jgi:cellulose synthase operon protein C
LITGKSLYLRTALVLAGVSLWPLAGQARDHAAAAQAALKSGDLRTAVIELRNAVRDDPQNAASRYDLARMELLLGDPASAERDVRAAEQRGYDARKTLPLLGEALLAQNRAADILKLFQPKGQDPALDAQILVLRGEAETRLGKPDDARTSFSKAEALDPSALPAWIEDAKLAMARGDTATALDRVEHALSAQPKAMEALVLKAALLRQKGDVAAARSLLDQVIAEQPPAIPARVERANLLIGLGKLAEGKADLDAVQKLTPNNVQAQFLRAVVLHEQHEDKDAAALLQRLDPIFSSYPRAYLLRAAVQEQLGELQQAEESAAKYIARVPGDMNGYKLLAQLYLKDRRPDQAITPLKHAVEVGKADAMIYEMLGRADAATGQQAAAAKAYAAAGKLAPGNVGLETALATALIASGEPDAALAGLEQALAKAPTDPALQEAVVRAAMATGDLDRADKALAQVKAGGGDTPVTQNLTAMLQLARLDAAGAQATLEKTVKANPDFVPGQINLARALIMQGQAKQAEALLAAVVERSPTVEPALTLLVEEQVRTNRAPAAIALLERAHAAAPADTALTARLGALLVRTGAAQKAFDLARAAQPPSGPPNPKLLLLAANAQVALKKPDDARETLGKLIALEPRAVEVRRQLAALMVQAGDFESARTLVKDGMRATPRVYQLYLDYALIDLKASGLPKALATAESLRQQDPGFQALSALAGDINMVAGKPEDAAKAYAQAAAAAPSAGLTERLSTAYARQSKPDEARAVMAAWLDKHPDDLAATAALSEFDIAAGKLDVAEQELKAVLARQPHNAAALNNLAWVYQLQGNKLARPVAEQAYLLAPTPQSADTLGWILTRDGDAGRGLVLLRQAAASGDPNIAYHLGVALNDVGQKADAVKVLNAVAGLKGEFTEKADAQHLLSQLTKGS